MSTSQDMTNQEIWQELVRFTGNEYAAAGIMGNFMAESSMNSSNLQGSYEKSLGQTDESYTQAVDNGTYNNFVHDSAGYGLAQWTWWEGKQGLLEYAQQNGQSVGSTKLQVSYLEQQLNGSFKNTLNALKNSKSVREASDIMMTQFERPSNQSEEAKSKRASFGTNFYNQYTGSSAASSPIDLSSSQEGVPAGLSDVTLEIEPENLNDVCKEWESKINSIDLSSIDVASVFAPLTNEGVATAYIASLQVALSKAESSLRSISSTITTTADEQTNASQNGANNNNNSYNNGSNSGGLTYSGGQNSGGYSDNSGSNSNYKFQRPTVIPVSKNTTTTNKNSDVNINTEFKNQVNELDADSYIQFMTTLGSISNGHIIDDLMDLKQASKLKKTLLESPNIDEDLKIPLEEMDENELQVTLQSILTDQGAFPDMTKHIIYEYTESLSKDTNLDVLKVSKEIQFFNQVDDLFNTIESLLEKENLQANVFSVYDGDVDDQVSIDAVNFIRVTVDYIAKANDINYEELLTNKDYEGMLKEELTNIEKSLSYFRTVNTMGTEASQLLYSNVMKEMEEENGKKD